MFLKRKHKPERKTILLIGNISKSLYEFRGDLLRELVNSNFEVYVAASDLDEGSPYWDLLRGLGVQACNIHFKRDSLNIFLEIQAIFKFIKTINLIKPDVIFLYNIKPTLYGLIASMLAKVPIRISMITGIGTMFYHLEETNQPTFKQKTFKTLYSFFLKTSSIILFQNNDDLKLFLKEGIISNDNKSLVINGSGINLAKFSFSPLPETISFLFAGRFIKSKGIKEFFRAAIYLKSKYPRAVFKIAGWSDDSIDSIEANVLEEIKNSKEIAYLGYSRKLDNEIKKSTVFVLPSYREGTPRSVLEAMAIGRPIITTFAPGCKETVIHNYNGMLIKPKSTSSLIRAMKLFLDGSLNEVDNKRFALNSRKLAERKYDVIQINKSITKIINQALNY